MRLMKRASIFVTFAVGALVVMPTAALAQVDHLGSAETFGVLGGSTVTNTGATTVAGDVGVDEGGSVTGMPITFTSGGAIHAGDAVAVQARSDASEAYDDVVEMTCTSNLTGQNLGGMSLAPGVYCFDADAQLTGTALMLTGSGPWTFVIGGTLTVTAPVTVATSTQPCNGSSVFWAVGDEATIGPATAFVGNLLAQNGAALGAGATVDGRVITLDPASTVTLNGNAVSACSFGNLLPVHAPVKVTGGGQINVPDPGSNGFSNYGFNATPAGTGGASGHLNYQNHVTGLHVNGTVTDVDVVTVDDEGGPQRVRFSGTCGEGCTFSVTVEDNGEPSVDDCFGITVVGSEADETTPDRLVKNGNIQVHLSLTTTLNADTFRAGDVMALGVSMTPGVAPPKVDAYLVLQLPNGELLSWTPAGLVPGLVPLARNVTPVNFRSVMARLVVPEGTPTGTYTWLSGQTAAGTLNLVSEISETRFTIAP